MLHAGMFTRPIATALGCHSSTILRLNQRLVQTGNVQDRLRTGRPKVTTPAQGAQTQASRPPSGQIPQSYNYCKKYYRD